MGNAKQEQRAEEVQTSEARSRATRGPRRCPSKSLGAWSDAVTPVTGKAVAARFRRGDVSLKPQHEPDYGNNITMHDVARAARTAPFARRKDGAQGMRAGWRRRGDARTQGRRGGEAEAARPAAFAGRGEVRKHAPRNVEQVMEHPEFKAWTSPSLIRNRSIPLRRAGGPERERGVTNQVMARGMLSEPARRAAGLATSATLELFEEIRSYRTAIPGPRRCLENPTSRVSPALGGNVRRTKGALHGRGGSVTRPCTSQETRVSTTATA